MSRTFKTSEEILNERASILLKIKPEMSDAEKSSLNRRIADYNKEVTSSTLGSAHLLTLIT